jgi:hypothetical protein
MGCYHPPKTGAEMTSEVVLLNKEAVVIAADSAVTVGRDPHPRYSKSANKIFDASPHGNLAVAIFSGAELDGVPWELAIKQFRQSDAAAHHQATVAEYIPAAIAFLQQHALMFPAAWLEEKLRTRLQVAGRQIFDDVKSLQDGIDDPATQPADRQALWDATVVGLTQTVSANALGGGLSQGNYDAVRARIPDFTAAVHEMLPADVAAVVDPTALCELAVEYAFRAPHYVYNSTGVIFAGYGASQIFPAFHQITVYGHIGSEICYSGADEHLIAHGSGAWIQPFAKFSMIQRFTDGFDYQQQSILASSINGALQKYTADLAAGGIQVPGAVAEQLITQGTADAVASWKQENYRQNFWPLRRVLNSLSVQEMAELAETLLVLESLRERVTSPSESVGGPVDVAAITKSDGLVWIRRKHYFESGLNLRYLQRVKTI